MKQSFLQKQTEKVKKGLFRNTRHVQNAKPKNLRWSSKIARTGCPWKIGVKNVVTFGLKMAVQKQLTANQTKVKSPQLSKIKNAKDFCFSIEK